MASPPSMATDGVDYPEYGQNLTSLELRKPYETALASLFLLVTMVIALAGNMAVVAGICLQHSLRSDLSNLLIINLSVTDLTSTVAIMLSAFVSLVMDRWPFGQIWCDFACALNYCLIIVSMLTLCCISIDRYQAVVHPFSYEGRVTRKRLLAVIVFIWLQGITFGIAPSLSNWVSYDYWEAICAIQWNRYRPDTVIYVILAFVCCFLGPGVVLVYCYVKILKEVNKQKAITVAIQTTNAASKKSDKAMNDKSRIVWSLLVVVFAYFICTTPFSVTKLIKVSADSTDVIPGPVNLASALLGYIASAINPLIYGIFRRDFRQAYKRLIKRICLQKCSNLSFLASDTSKADRKQVSFISDFDNVTRNRTSSTIPPDDEDDDNHICDSKSPTSVSQVSVRANIISETSQAYNTNLLHPNYAQQFSKRPSLTVNGASQCATKNAQHNCIEEDMDGLERLLSSDKKWPVRNSLHTEKSEGNSAQPHHADNGELQTSPHPHDADNGELQTSPHPHDADNGELQTSPHPHDADNGELQTSPHPHDVDNGELQTSPHPHDADNGELQTSSHPHDADNGEPKPHHADNGVPKPHHTNNYEPQTSPQPHSAYNGEPKQHHATNGEPKQHHANNGEPQTCMTEVHYQTIVVKSLSIIDTCDRNKI